MPPDPLGCPGFTALCQVHTEEGNSPLCNSLVSQGFSLFAVQLVVVGLCCGPFMCVMWSEMESRMRVDASVGGVGGAGLACGGVVAIGQVPQEGHPMPVVGKGGWGDTDS